MASFKQIIFYTVRKTVLGSDVFNFLPGCIFYYICYTYYKVHFSSFSNRKIKNNNKVRQTVISQL